MILTEKAKELIDTRTKTRIALAMNKSVYSVAKWIKDNDPNGPLTTTAAVQIISEETGIPVNEVLEAEPVEALQK